MKTKLGPCPMCGSEEPPTLYSGGTMVECASRYTRPPPEKPCYFSCHTWAWNQLQQLRQEKAELQLAHDEAVARVADLESGDCENRELVALRNLTTHLTECLFAARAELAYLKSHPAREKSAPGTETFFAFGADLREEDLRRLRHALGCTQADPKKWGYRRYYHASSEDLESMTRLEKYGLMKRGKDFTWHATEVGCRALNFTTEQIKRAMEP